MSSRSWKKSWKSKESRGKSSETRRKKKGKRWKRKRNAKERRGEKKESKRGFHPCKSPIPVPLMLQLRFLLETRWSHLQKILEGTPRLWKNWRREQSNEWVIGIHFQIHLAFLIVLPSLTVVKKTAAPPPQIFQKLEEKKEFPQSPTPARLVALKPVSKSTETTVQPQGSSEAQGIHCFNSLQP